MQWVTAEYKLLWGVLERAILDALGNVSGMPGAGRFQRQRVSVRALQWLLSDDIAEWSCSWICAHLNLDAVTVRNRVLQWRREGEQFGGSYNGNAIEQILGDGADPDFFTDRTPLFSAPSPKRKKLKTLRRKLRKVSIAA